MGRNDGLLSRIATNGRHGEDSPYFDGWKAYESDPFHPRHNPGGVIQMGLSENQLSLELIREWIKNHPEASICSAEGLPQFMKIANFQDYHGLPAFLQGIAKLMEKVRGGRVKFDPNRVVMSGGGTGAQETLAFCLADPGDAFLVPTPYYPAFDRDLRWRTGVELLPVHCTSSNQFRVTKTALESAYEKARKDNIRVKGVLITNPSNPLGTTMDKHTLQTLVKFVNERRIHLVCDELYGATIFKEPRFVSISEVIEEDPNCDKNLIHIAYSLSKDFGLPDSESGSCIPTTTRWIFSSGLEEVGIRCLDGNAGVFCWMDLRHLLKEATEDGELELWRVIVNNVKLNVSPGSSFHCAEPGWFRVCITNMDDDTTHVALKRIRTFVYRINGADAEARMVKKKKRGDNSALRIISLPRRFEVEISRSPSLMSPQSPLVHATT
uniref:1-aminocyclopropane-1-carboxylate synthase n=1 Tax=Ananas comosus var. bracteatus TaxID=296719 RepID=A0A6V7QMY6_ANACO|nr:unnamed protein product [Ananas comosus var. bracteatus]